MGIEESFDSQKIYNRMVNLCQKSPKINDEKLDLKKVINLTMDQSFDRISTVEIDKLTSEICAYKGIEFPE